MGLLISWKVWDLFSFAVFQIFCSTVDSFTIVSDGIPDRVWYVGLFHKLKSYRNSAEFIILDLLLNFSVIGSFVCFWIENPC